MNAYNPYIMQMPQTQELGGLAPYYQNIGQQQAMQNMAMQQAQGLTQDAGRTAQGGMNPIALAMMLRKSSNPYVNAQNAMNQYGASNVYGYGGQGVVPTMTTGMD